MRTGAEAALLTEIYRGLPSCGRARLIGFARSLAADFALEDLEDEGLGLLVYEGGQISDPDNSMREGRVLELEEIQRVAT